MANIRIFKGNNKKTNYFLFYATFLLLGLISCKNTNGGDPTPLSKLELIKLNNWVIDKYTLIDNSVIPDAKLNENVKLLRELTFQFRKDSQVRALLSGQIINGGTWELSNDEKNISIDIPGLKDEFKLVEVTKTKLVLRPNEKVFPVLDNKTEVNMEFKPGL